MSIEKSIFGDIKSQSIYLPSMFVKLIGYTKTESGKTAAIVKTKNEQQLVVEFKRKDDQSIVDPLSRFSNPESNTYLSPNNNVVLKLDNVRIDGSRCTAGWVEFVCDARPDNVASHITMLARPNAITESGTATVDVITDQELEFEAPAHLVKALEIHLTKVAPFLQSRHFCKNASLTIICSPANSRPVIVFIPNIKEADGTYRYPKVNEIQDLINESESLKKLNENLSKGGAAGLKVHLGFRLRVYKNFIAEKPAYKWVHDDCRALFNLKNSSTGELYQSQEVGFAKLNLKLWNGIVTGIGRADKSLPLLNAKAESTGQQIHKQKQVNLKTTRDALEDTAHNTAAQFENFLKKAGQANSAITTPEIDPLAQIAAETKQFDSQPKKTTTSPNMGL